MAVKKMIYYRNWEELPVVLTLGQCAVILNVTYELANKWAKEGKLPAIKFGKEWRIEKEKLRAMFNSLSEEGTGVA